MRRSIAAAGAILVFALGLFAVSPELHQQLHHSALAGSDDACAIALFASGVAAPPAMPVPLPPAVHPAPALPFSPDELLLPSPEGRLQPERGPPLV